MKHIYSPSLTQMPARLSSSLNQPPTPTKAAIAVREIVRSYRTKNRGWCVTALTGIRAGTRRALHPWEVTVYQRSARIERYHLFFPAARCAAAVSARTTRSAAKALEKIFPGTRLGGNFSGTAGTGRAHNINLVTAETQYLSVATARLKTGQTAAFSIPIVYNCGGYETLEAVDGAGSLYRYLAAGF